MITPEEARTRAENNFRSGLNCTQSVVEVFAAELGFDPKTIMSIALPFGGGTCRMRETCGTFSGIMMCLGMFKGIPGGDKDVKDDIYKDGQALAERFKKSNGSIICRELLGLAPLNSTQDHTPSSPVSEARTREYYKKRPCPALCGEAAAIFAEYLAARKKEAELE